MDTLEEIIEMRKHLTRQFALAFMERADPDGGYGYAVAYAASIVRHYDGKELMVWTLNIAAGDEIDYDPNSGDFFIKEDEEAH